MKLKSNKAITLVALIITIIILLILAGVSLSMVLGENGLINKAQSSVDKYQESSENEQELLNKIEKYLDGKGLGQGSNTENNTGNNPKSYVGYYADVDGDGEVDGIIYADLAVGGSGTWNSSSNGAYTIQKVTTVLKDYYISEKGYKGKFGTKDVLTSKGTGKDRFYVMALEDFNPGTRYCWYDAAYGKLDNLVENDFNDLGQGKTNTTTMIAEWNKGEKGKYGAQDDNGKYKDMWGVIQKADSAGKKWNLSKWFVPSKAEWAAFGDKLGVTMENYRNYGFDGYYWSSDQKTSSSVYYAGISYLGVGVYCYLSVEGGYYVRLSTTF